MAPVPGMFDVFLNHTAAAAFGFFIVALLTIVFAGHFSAREVDSKKLVPEKKPNLETMAAEAGKFDVFLNHRGPDVKGGFASHLHQALQEARCRPFLDKESLEKGQDGQKEIYEALRCASVHVAIFSKQYADSKYCLDELCAMLESEKLIIPVFYDVSPSDLRCKLQSGPYTKAFRKIHWRRSPSDVEKWKRALCSAAKLNGFKLTNYDGDEARLKTAIVSKIRDHLRASQLPPVPPHQVRLEETSKELIETLNRMERNVGILSLVGMGGIGKTTLAKEIYRSFEKNETFEKKSILMNVRESALRDSEILDLKKQMAHDVFKENVTSTGEFNECCNRVMDCKVLIVVDDIDQKGQFDQLIPDINKLRPGSRVIITSRDSNVVNNIMKNENCKYWRHEMELLSTIDSIHLFNQHAFHSANANDGFQELAKKVADACCGLPLALEIIGCFLFDKRGEDALESTWPQTIKALIERKDILDKLMISYKGLSLEARMMFLDIACFMIGQHEHVVMQIFESCKFDYNGPAPSFNSLKDKCLVKLDENRQIVMHDLLRDMGRQVVKKKSRKMEKGTPSHLWDPEIVQQVLQNKEGTNTVRGLSTFGVGRGGISATNVAENYIGMNRLHFLLLDGDNVKGDFSTWSRELSWLQWTNSDISVLPLELDLQKLAVLDLTSNKELMQIWPNDLEITYKDLRTLILSNCEALKELPKDIGKLLRLNELNLAFCSSLKALPNSVFQLKELKHMNLSHCSELGCLPDSIVNLSQLKTFNLQGCSKLKNLPVKFGKLQSLVELDLSGCSELRCLPDSIVDLSQLKTFNLQGCSKLENLPVKFGKLQSLVKLDLSGCFELGCLPDSIVDLSQLKTFKLRGCSKLENLLVKVDDDQSCSPPGKGNDHHQQISNYQNPFGSRKISFIESFGSHDYFQQQKQPSTVEAGDTSENSFQIGLPQLENDSIFIVGRKGIFEGADAIEFLFEQVEDMSKVVGVGLQRSKVVVTEQFGVMVIQISEHMWLDLWKETSFLPMNINVPKLPINYKLPMCNLSPEESSKRLGIGLGGFRSEGICMYIENNMSKQTGEMFPLIFELAKKMGLKSENAKSSWLQHLKDVSTKIMEGKVNDQGGSSNEPMDGGDHDQGATSHEPMEGAISNQGGTSSEHMELGGQVDQQSFGGNPSQLLSESPLGRGPIVSEKNGSLTVIVIPECGGTFHKGLTKELAEPDDRIKCATIAPWLKFKFEKLGDIRKITTTTETRCNLGGGQLKYHEDLDLGYYHDNITISLTCEENLAARLSFGTVTSIDITKSSTTETFTGSRSIANQMSGQANVQVQIPLVGIGMQAQGNLGVIDTFGDSCAIAATMESSNTQFVGFLVNPNQCPSSLNFNFLYHVEIMEEIAKGRRQFMHAGINKTFWPTIVGEWFPLDENQSCLYKFNAERDITSIGSLRRSTSKGEMPVFMQQRYEVSMFINHAMSHIHHYGTTEFREPGVQYYPMC